MAKKIEKNIITGLDIGTSKVIALIGEISRDGHIEIIGIGRHASKGLKRGVVVDIETTVNSIQRAVQEAELMADCEVRQVYAGIAGSHIRSLNSHGIVAIREHEVSPADVDRVLDAAKAVAIPADQKILHVLPQEFIIDNQGSIKEPAGMAGVRLEARVHIVTGAVSAAQNIAKCINRCGLEVNDIILEQLASSHAVLTDDEKELGVCLIDIGGGTTDIAVFFDGSIQYTAVIPIAGDQVTNDIAMAFRTPTKAAETIKVQHACAISEQALRDEMIEVTNMSDRTERKISALALADVVSARYEELFYLVRNNLVRAGFDQRLAAGIVMTGGGAGIQGAQTLATYCFDMPVRLGYATRIAGLPESLENPACATAVGLLLHGYRRQYESTYMSFPLNTATKNVWLRMREWFQGNF